MHHVAYFEAVDLVISTISGYAMYRKLEDLLLKATREEDYNGELQCVCGFYTEVDANSLKVQLTNLATHFAATSNSITTLHEIVDYLRSLTSDAKSFFKKVCHAVSLILVMPATRVVVISCISQSLKLELPIKN